jgi:hypothetical protein
MKQSVVTPFIRRVLWVAGAVAGMGVAAVLLIYFLIHSTVAFGQKCGGGQCWGYQLEQYAVSKRTMLTITGSWGLHLRYEFPRMLVERANDDRWLAGDRAIYLNLRIKPFSNQDADGTHLQILYDFQRGELYLACPLQLWRARDYQTGNPGKNWLTDDEFQSVVRRIEP